EQPLASSAAVTARVNTDLFSIVVSGGALVIGMARADLAREEATHHDKEHRYEEDCKYGCSQHAADHASTHGVAALRAGAGGDGQRQYAEDKGNRGHQDGTEAQAAGFQRCLHQT